MKLNPDCVRDILLTVEEHTGYRNQMYYPSESDDDYELLKKYPQDEVHYHIRQCNLSGFFTNISHFMGGSLMIHDLTPLGHEFLNNIRSDNVWNKTKEGAKKVGSFSLDTLNKIAINVISAIIKQNM